MPIEYHPIGTIGSALQTPFQVQMSKNKVCIRYLLHIYSEKMNKWDLQKLYTRYNILLISNYVS